MTTKLITNKNQFTKTDDQILSGFGIVEGVLNRELVLEHELVASDWNAQLATNAHPTVTVNNKKIKVSARSAEGSDFIVGNVSLSEKRGNGLYFDVVLNEDLGLSAGDVVEVSTAYYRDVIQESGIFNGKPYDRKVTNIRPDHVAILLNEKGACSIDDGCSLTVNQDEEQVGVMIALYPSLEDANEIAIENGQSAKDLHVTLTYLGNISEQAVTERDLLAIVDDFATHNILIRASLNGVIRFCDSDDNDAFCLNVDSPDLPDLREHLVNRLGWHGINIQKQHGFTPHLTLSYIDQSSENPMMRVKPREITFSQIGLAWGGNVTLFDLKGNDRMSNEDITNTMQSVLAPINERLAALDNTLNELATNAEQNALALQVVTDRLNAKEAADKTAIIERIVANSQFSAEELDAYDLSHLQKISAMSMARTSRHYQPPTTNSANQQGFQRLGVGVNANAEKEA